VYSFACKIDPRSFDYIDQIGCLTIKVHTVVVVASTLRTLRTSHVMKLIV